MGNKRNRRLLVAASIIFVTAGAALAGSGNCVTAEMPAPATFPDGSLHEGSLRICLEQHLNPVSGIHTAFADGEALGFLRSRRVEAEGAAKLVRPYFVFEKSSQGDLRLVAYAQPDGERMATYVLAEPSRIRPQQTATKAKKRERRNRYAWTRDLDQGTFLVAYAK